MVEKKATLIQKNFKRLSSLVQFISLEHCESVGEGEGYLKLPNYLPELSSSFRTKLAQWDDLGVSRTTVEHRRKKRGSSSASAVLQRMSLPGEYLRLKFRL